MTTVYGIEYTEQYITVPSARIDSGKVATGVKALIATHVFGSDSEITDTGDKLYFGKLPKGTRIIDIKYICSFIDNAAFAIGIEKDSDSTVAYDLITALNANTDPLRCYTMFSPTAILQVDGTGAGLVDAMADGGLIDWELKLAHDVKLYMKALDAAFNSLSGDKITFIVEHISY